MTSIYAQSESAARRLLSLLITANVQFLAVNPTSPHFASPGAVGWKVSFPKKDAETVRRMLDEHLHPTSDCLTWLSQS